MKRLKINLTPKVIPNRKYKPSDGGIKKRRIKLGKHKKKETDYEKITKRLWEMNKDLFKIFN